MAPTSTLPFEIEETIVDILATEDDEDLSSVKACSLVRQEFLPLCRKHIFASVVLNDCNVVSPSPTTPMLERLLSKTPEIAYYIRKLDYNIVLQDFTSPSTQGCLKRISRLQFLRVWHYGRWKFDWSSNRLRPALLHLLHLPTLTHLDVFAIDNFVLSDLTPCVNLKRLDIGQSTTVAAENTFSATLPDHSIRLNEFVARIRTAMAIMKICTAQRPDGQPLIDFSSLTNITITLEKHDDIEASQELFKRCGQLTDVYISFWNPTLVWPGLADMLRPSMQTLKHVDMAIHVNDADDDPLASLPSELEDMCNNKNIIENISILVNVATDPSDCKRGDEWGRLDTVLTRSGWPALKQISLAIEIGSYYSDDVELEVALQKLPETQFPRLSSSKSVSFEFKVTSILV
ncbi:hypothetical protein BDZ97DRAFT_2073981 [Flammula alnicola]|nr:hypothetical protein BDZ97DRAFT_2073981 [Flammula alnicola]